MFVQVKTEAAGLDAEKSRSFVCIFHIIEEVFDKNSFSWRSEQGIDLESLSQCLWKQIFLIIAVGTYWHNNNIMQNLETVNFDVQHRSGSQTLPRLSGDRASNNIAVV